MTKHTYEECLAFMFDQIQTDPMIIRNHINVLTDYDVQQLNNVLWPGVLVESNWFRISTRRPSIDTGPDAPYSSGTDKVIRLIVNELWEDEGHKLEATITEEFGHLEVEFDIRW